MTRRRKGLGIASKLAFSVVASTALIFLVVFLVNYRRSYSSLLDNVEQNVDNLAHRTANRIDKVLAAVEKVPQNVAHALEASDLDRENLLKTVRLMVEKNPEICGGTIAFEPNAFDPAETYFAPYCYLDGDTFAFTFLGGKGYHYFYMDWYAIPRELDRPVWSEPYYDEGGGNFLMATYSVPFHSGPENSRAFRGVVTADISLAWLQRLVSSISIFQSGYAFLISQNGTVITHPVPLNVMNETIFNMAEAGHDAELRSIGKEMIAGNSGFVPSASTVNGRDGFLYYLSLPTNGWSLGIFIPRDELMADLSRLNRTVFSLALAGVTLLALVVILIARNIIRPLETLTRATGDIASGNLDIQLPEVRRHDEVGTLAASFLGMRDALKEHIRELQETTAAREKIESELKIARDIQMDLLPKIFPPFPQHPEFDIYAEIEPAREVGGDLYDFYMLAPDRFLFLIGDVSDKGVPASLFMAVTKTLLKAAARDDVTPDELLTRVNAELSEDNDSCMFVTVFCGILNTGTGELLYANGGHEHPVLLRRDGPSRQLESTGGMPLGAEEDASYTLNRVYIEPGDVLFLYTDGAIDALNAQGERFTEDRLFREIEKLRTLSIQQAVQSLSQTIRGFSSGVPQADDITLMMVLRQEPASRT